jgi:CubicO group peptidase (beta-lactamase class C family)
MMGSHHPNGSSCFILKQTYKRCASCDSISKHSFAQNFNYMRKLVAFILLVPLAVTAQKDYPSLLNKYMEAQTKVNGFSGNVLIARKGKVIYKKAFGLANREWDVPNTIQTKFKIASVTKQFTAAAVLQLAEVGKLNLEDKLSKYFPDFPKGDSVTLHMLLTHTSGIKSYTSLPNFSYISALPYTKDSVIALFKNLPYDFSPGTQWRYNNSGFFLLGCIIEKVSGQVYSDYMLKNVFRQGGLYNTGVDKSDSILTHRAMGYVKTPTRWKNAVYVSTEFPYSAGGLFSTVEDLYQWQKALFGGQIISSAMFAKMSTPYINRYGYALDLDSLQNHKRVGHDGNIEGFGSYCYYYPFDDVNVVILSNKQGSTQWIGQALGAILFNIPIITPYKHLEVKIDDAKQLDKYVGKYITPENIILEITKKNDSLFVRLGTNQIELKAESNHKFFWGNGSDIQVDFIAAKSAFVHAQLIRNGFISELKKID